MAHHQLDELDEKILKLIIGNARMPFLEVARECNVSGAAIHQRIQKLTNLGVIKGSEFIVDNTKVGYETCAYMGLQKRCCRYRKSWNAIIQRGNTTCL